MFVVTEDSSGCREGAWGWEEGIVIVQDLRKMEGENKDF